MKFTVRTHIKASAEIIYKAWLDSQEHIAMTGGSAEVSSLIVCKFTAWDGYISGSDVALDENLRIHQKWQTTEFLDYEEDSAIEIKLNEYESITEIVLTHSNLPEHRMQYKDGWQDHYFTPMRQHVSNLK